MCFWSQDLRSRILSLGYIRVMSTSMVEQALARAALRAQRLAELDMAHTTLERVLNFPHPPETLPWGDAMSKSYLFHVPCPTGIERYANCNSVIYDRSPNIHFHCYRLNDATATLGTVTKGKARTSSSAERSTTASPPAGAPSDASSPGSSGPVCAILFGCFGVACKWFWLVVLA